MSHQAVQWINRIRKSDSILQTGQTCLGQSAYRTMLSREMPIPVWLRIFCFPEKGQGCDHRARLGTVKTTSEGYTVNSYFADHPEMVLGDFTTESTQYGKQEVTVKAKEGADLAEQIKEAVKYIQGTITEQEILDTELEEQVVSIPADPNIKNFSFALVGEDIYYRENSVMNKMELPVVTGERVRGMVAIRDATNRLLERQLEECSDEEVASLQAELNQVYDSFTAKYGLLSSNANKRAFSMDSSYCLLTSLEFWTKRAS